MTLATEMNRKNNYDKVLQEMMDFGAEDVDWRSGKTWSLTYHLDDEHSAFLKKAYATYFTENGLNPVAFKSLKKFEHEIIRMSLDMLNGPADSVGTFTSGGTGSILMAVKTYREYYFSRNKIRKIVQPGMQPEMILPASAHPAFHKAAYYFGVKIVNAPLTKDFRVDVKAVKKLINGRTMMVVASAPCYPYGVVDPIEELSTLLYKKKIPLHVDACVGGFLLPYVEQLGYDIPPFDFRCKGVTSISADIHKYGYAAKGASVVLYRNMEIMKHQFFVLAGWCGGAYISPALQGSRPGGALAAAWGALKAIGPEGYLANADKLMKLSKKMQSELNAIPEIEVLGNPQATLVAFASTTRAVDIYVVGDVLEKKGWHIDRQQNPSCLHLMINPVHEEVYEEYISDLKKAVAYAKEHPELKMEGNAAMYGMMAKIPMKGMVKQELLKIMEKMYGPDNVMPGDEEEEKDDFKSKLANGLVSIIDRIEEFRSK